MAKQKRNKAKYDRAVICLSLESINILPLHPGFLCLIPVGVAFLVMGSMMGENMKKENGRIPECTRRNVK